MRTTIVGQLVTAGGENLRSYFSHDPAHMWAPIRYQAWAVPAAEVRTRQAASIPLRADHGAAPIGRVTHLERRSSDGSLWCVAETDLDIRSDRPLYFSVELTSTAGTVGTDAEITGVSLAEKSASIALSPLSVIRDALDEEGHRPIGFKRELLERAAHRRAGEPLDVVDSVEPHPAAPMFGEVRQVVGPIEFRSASAVDVHRSRREIDVVVAPVGAPTRIYEPGRSYLEEFLPGCFAGVEKNPERIKCNMHHQYERTCGRAIRLDPYDERGLVGTLKIARTRDGDDALALVADDLLAVSAGFGIPAGGEEWRGRTHRRVRRAILDHVALTCDPAYESAVVIDARNARTTATPNLDRARQLLATVR